MKPCSKCLELKPEEQFSGRKLACNQCRAAARREYYYANKGKVRASVKRWDDANKQSLNEYKRSYQANKCATDPVFKLNKTMRHRLYKMLKGTGSWSKLQPTLGYTTEQLKVHLESQFADGMSWANHGKWHIDHVIPLCYFTEVHQMKQAWELQNLQPLWATDNLKKGTQVCPALVR